MLVFLSDVSVRKRGFVQKEFRLAEEAHGRMPEDAIFLIPVQLSDCDVPQRFSHLHCAKLYESDGFEKLLKSLGHSNSPHQNRLGDRTFREMHELSSRLKSLEEALLVAPSEYQNLIVGELTTMGVTKLLPRGLYSQITRTNGGGAYFSFARQSHEYGNGTDIELQGESFSVGFSGMDFGFFVPLGECDHGNFQSIGNAKPLWITPDLVDAWDYAWNYTSPHLRAEVRQASRSHRSGLQVGGCNVSSRVSALESHAWLLRSFAFHGREGSDLLVVIRCLKRLEDGSAIIAWRILREGSLPFPSGPDEVFP